MIPSRAIFPAMTDILENRIKGGGVAGHLHGHIEPFFHPQFFLDVSYFFLADIDHTGSAQRFCQI